MPKLLFKLEEEASTDLRSNEVAYKLTVENVGITTTELLSLRTRYPSNVVLSDVKNPTFVALKSEYDDLCKQIKRILDDYLLTTKEEVKIRHTKVLKEVISKAFEFEGNTLASIFRIYARIFTGTLIKRYNESLLALEAYSENIENLSQARDAYKRWFTDLPDTFEKKIFDSKMTELERIEIEMVASGELASSIAFLEPDSSFSQTYVFRFMRNSWTPKIYNISIDGVYLEEGNPRKYSGGASIYLTISPKPIPLTFLTMFSGVLGALIKYSVEISDKNPMIPKTLAQLETAANSPRTTLFILNALTGAILSLIFFNIYEYTSIGKNIGIGVGWRSALLIGALCGLFGDKIFAALKVFVS